MERMWQEAVTADTLGLNSTWIYSLWFSQLKIKSRNKKFLECVPKVSVREWKRNEMKVTEEYCWAITRTVGRLCRDRSGYIVMEFAFQLDCLLHAYADYCMYTKFRLTSNLSERNDCLRRGTSIPEFVWRDWGRPWKSLSTIRGIVAGNWTGHVSDMEQECYLLDRHVRWIWKWWCLILEVSFVLFVTDFQSYGVKFLDIFPNRVRFISRSCVMFTAVQRYWILLEFIM
jgi:hypothetical protein